MNARDLKPTLLAARGTNPQKTGWKQHAEKLLEAQRENPGQHGSEPCDCSCCNQAREAQIVHFAAQALEALVQAARLTKEAERAEVFGEYRWSTTQESDRLEALVNLNALATNLRNDAERLTADATASFSRD